MKLVHIHVCGAPVVDAHPEPLPAHRLVRSCIEVHGHPMCYGAAHDGPRGCYCTDTLAPEHHARCAAEAHAAYEARGRGMCDDCAFRKGSPESDELERIAASPVPFRCHVGMPVDARGGTPQRDGYAPRMVGGEAPDYPVCAGWQRAHELAAARAPRAKRRGRNP